MTDPTRLRSSTGTPESLLLQSAPRLEPPSYAEDEVWRKLTATLALGSAASATATVARAAASGGSGLLGKLTSATLLKWGAVLVVGAPVLAVTAHAVLRHRSSSAAAVASVREPGAESVPDVLGSLVAREAAPRMTSDPPPTNPPALKVASAADADNTIGHKEPRAAAPSALRAEIRLLGVARSRFAAGDYGGALAEVGQLQSRFPRGRLVQEREVLAIDALQAMGEHVAVLARASGFLQRFPDSPYAAHVRQLIEP